MPPPGIRSPHCCAISMAAFQSVGSYDCGSGSQRSWYHSQVLTLLKETQGCSTSMREKPGWMIACWIKSERRSVMPENPLATNPALMATATPTGLKGAEAEPCGWVLVTQA